MRINQEMQNELDPYGQASLRKIEADNKVRAGKDAGAAASNADTINLSSEGRLRTAFHRSAMVAPEIRQDKVDHLKNLVASGEYRVDSHDIADKMIREEAAIFAPESL